MSSKGSSFGDFLTGVVVGGMVGYLVAMLYAPRRGEETRQMLAERSRELRDRAVETAEKTGKLVEEKRAQIEEQAVSVVDRARERVMEGKHQAETKVEEVRAQASDTLRSAADEVDPYTGQ